MNPRPPAGGRGQGRCARRSTAPGFVSDRRIIDARSEPWGINVISAEVKDVRIPAALQDAMSMQAQAERERQARVILGDSERQVAEIVQRGGADLRRQSDRFSSARDEHAVRRPEAQQCDDRHRAFDRGRS